MGSKGHLLLVNLPHGLSRAWMSKWVADLVVYSYSKICSRRLYHIVTWRTAAMLPPCMVLSSGFQGHGRFEHVLITTWQSPDGAAIQLPSSSGLLCAGFPGRRKLLLFPNLKKKPDGETTKPNNKLTIKKSDKRDRCFSKGEQQQKVQKAKQGKD